MKNVVPVIALLAILAGGGYYGFQQYQAAQATKAKLAAKASEAASQASEAARRAAAAKQTEEISRKQAAEVAERQEIDAALKPMKVSSLMPGQPGIAIIDKHEYAEGDDLTLPKGRKLRISRVQDDGVLLAYNRLTFHLDAPGPPDLAASRKK